MYNFLIIFISIIIRTNEKENLRLVFEIYKHGAISPKITQEKELKDLFGEKWDDKDELTSVGLRQEFLIGYINKLRYTNTFIKEQFDPREVLFYSLNSNKSILSSYALSQGFFPPKTGLTLTQKQILNAVPPIDEKLYKDGFDGLGNLSLPKQISIVPTQIIYENDFIIRATNENLCEGIKKNRNKKDFWSKEMKEQKENIFKKYSNSIAKEMNEKDDINNLFKDYDKTRNIFNTILSEYYDGRNIEKLTNKNNVSDLINDIKKFYLFDYQNKNNKEIVIHSIAPFMRWMIELINLRIKKDKEGKENELDYILPKLILISSDDSIFKPLEFIMDICFNISIEYSDFGSYLNFELIKINQNSSSNIKDEDYFIVYHFNGKYKKSISLPDFKKEIQDLIKSENDVKKFCNFIDKTNTPIYKNVYFILSMILTIVLIVLVIFSIKQCKTPNEVVDFNLTSSIHQQEKELLP